MASFVGMGRTNYFQIKPECEEQYRELYGRLRGSCLMDFTKEEDGVIIHGFGAYDSISFMIEGTDEGGEHWEDFGELDDFEIELQPLLAEGEIFIYQEVGYEGLRYGSGWADIVTADKRENVSLDGAIAVMARKLLGDENYSPCLAY